MLSHFDRTPNEHRRIDRYDKIRYIYMLAKADAMACLIYRTTTKNEKIRKAKKKHRVAHKSTKGPAENKAMDTEPRREASD